MRYEVPTTSRQAAALLVRENGLACIFAGGTDLMVQMKLGLIEPILLIDIKHIEAMRTISATSTGTRIGAAVSCAEVGENKRLKAAWPGVVEAANLIGSEQIQGRCTLAGNLCNASPAADSVPALIAAKAWVIIVSEGGRRTLALEKIITGPGQTCLARGEIIEAIVLPKRPARCADAYLRFIPRTEMDIAVVSAGVSLTLARGVVKKARIVLGAVAATAILVPAAARAIIGTKLTKEALARLSLACSEACNPIDDKRGTVEYRIKVAGVLGRRAAIIAYKRAGGA